MEKEPPETDSSPTDLLFYHQVTARIQEQNPDKDCRRIAELDLSDEEDEKMYQDYFGGLSDEEKSDRGLIFEFIQDSGGSGDAVLGVFQLSSKIKPA